MFVFGEVADPLPESTLLVEDIVRSQVIEIVILNYYLIGLLFTNFSFKKKKDYSSCSPS